MSELFCAPDIAILVTDTFPVLARSDERAYGEYRTKRVVLDVSGHLGMLRVGMLPPTLRIVAPGPRLCPSSGRRASKTRVPTRCPFRSGCFLRCK